MSKYKWVLNKDIKVDMVTLDGISFESKWIKIENGFITIKSGYAWDGSSPKFFIGNCIIGTWDGFINDKGLQQAYIASLVHDALYQYLNNLKPLGYTRKAADIEFKRLLEREQFLLSKSYYTSVRLFGGFYV